MFFCLSHLDQKHEQNDQRDASKYYDIEQIAPAVVFTGERFFFIFNN